MRSDPMKNSMGILKEGTGGLKPAELCRKHGRFRSQ